MDAFFKQLPSGSQLKFIFQKQRIIRQIAIFISIFLVFVSNNTQAAVSTFTGSIYLEALGSGGYYSLNYLEAFRFSNKCSINLRLGASIVRIRDFDWKLNPDVKIPVSLGMEYGNMEKLVFNIGVIANTFVYYNISSERKERNNYLNYFAFIGYKHRFKNGFFIFGGYNPIVTHRDQFHHWAALGFGYTF